MTRLSRWILLFCMAAVPGLAATVSFQGTFGADNQVALFSITANSPETVTIQTYSYAGGVVGSTAVPAGGFAPAAFLFDTLGDVVLTLPNDGTCSHVGMDPTTEHCDDLFYENILGPDTFTLALAVYDNRPVDMLADGFVQDSNPGFTCQQPGVTGGSFCDGTTALGDSRKGDYFLTITGADSVSEEAPEPGTLVLLLGGGAWLALRRRVTGK